MPHPIPDIHTLDTTRPDATLTFATDLITAASAHGLFLAHTPSSPATTRLRHTAATLIHTILHLLDTLPPGQALTIAAARTTIDIIHRIAHRTPLPPRLLTPAILRAYNAHIHRDTTVDPYTLCQAITTAANTHPTPDITGAPLRWASQAITHWHTLILNPPPDTTPNDTIKRLTILLNSDLSAFHTHQEEFKQKLISRHAHLLSHTPATTAEAEATGIDTTELPALNALLNASHPYLHPLPKAI